MANNSLGSWLLKNIGGAVVLVAALVIGASIFLSLYTRHGKSVIVPDFTNLDMAAVQNLAASAGVNAVVADSVFVRRMEKGAVYSQYPKAGMEVKAGRTVKLTVNAKQAKMVTMPNLVGFSLRQANSELKAKGLVLGKLTYISDIATNNVMKQLYRSREIASGREVEAGSRIDLVVGLNPDDNMTLIPDVVGMKYMRAVDAIHDNSLNVRRLSFDKDVKTYSDSLSAVVYRQTPEPSEFSQLMGTEVTLFLTLDESKLPSKK